jgi:hypothetical protein
MFLADHALGLGVADEDEAGGAIGGHAQGYMGRRPQCFRVT